MTTGEYLFESLGGVGHDLVDMAEKMTFPKSLWRRAVPWAACLVMIAGLAAGALYLLPPQEDVLEMQTVQTENTVRAENPAFPDVLASASSACAARLENNLTLACQALDGAVVEPGAVFSFNDALGELSAEKGYTETPEYAYDGEEPVLGGGVSQAASTLYMATLCLGLEQVEREPHLYGVSYVPAGMDAAVYYGMMDYQFRNTLDQAVQIAAWLEDGVIYINLLGVKADGTTAALSCEILETYPWETVERVDETKPADYRELVIRPITGYRVAVYRTVYDGEGNELSSEQVGISTYQKRDAVYVVGTIEN